ncbi:phytanoyl-CoA dioxygenase family protein [Nostoc sp. CENA67]|uniref:Phytanoyl-CoA dioxygenase family protein n=1 Tax=Amazonocrinis nigriterrae CENA67 TaxID=2794033 RepID=A0A8J7HP29_9NOST|nr:phytanoyl-CoA dioxygenase family protein [Amazonocrinis nigriterrae]MBH8561033.1 phytanoyl-CoA dioxygenase family protein [Amazonocrinis nigriterrae CENA67]
METKIARYVRLIKQALTDYKWTLYYFQMLILNPKYRKLVGSFFSYILPKTTNRKINNEIQKDLQSLKQNGLLVLENFVTKTQIQDIKLYLSTKLCTDRQRPGRETFIAPGFAPKSCIHAYYKLEDTINIPHVLELANNQRILTIIEEIFGAKPTISMIHIWWLLSGFDAHANSNERYFTHPGEFHRDVDDWSEIKLFIYLTDVDEDSGPHAYIKKSHTWLLPPKTRDLDINNPDFPIKDNLIKLTGEAGFAWLENSYVLHRSLVPKNKHRLIVAVTYTLFPLPFGPKVPLRSYSDGNQFDSYVNRIYLKFR